jgi:hypothetical protein
MLVSDDNRLSHSSVSPHTTIETIHYLDNIVRTALQHDVVIESKVSASGLRRKVEAQRQYPTQLWVVLDDRIASTSDTTDTLTLPNTTDYVAELFGLLKLRVTWYFAQPGTEGPFTSELDRFVVTP